MYRHAIDISLTDTAEKDMILSLHEIDETSGHAVEVGRHELRLGRGWHAQ